MTRHLRPPTASQAPADGRLADYLLDMVVRRSPWATRSASLSTGLTIESMRCSGVVAVSELCADETSVRIAAFLCLEHCAGERACLTEALLRKLFRRGALRFRSAKRRREIRGARSLSLR